MRRLLLVIAALAGALLQTGVAVAAPVLHLSGWKASAGKPETFTITRVGGNGAATVTFRTSDGSATAPSDYAATAQMLSWARGQTIATVTVPTFVNPLKAGQSISFTASITANGVSSSAIGLIVEPAAPPPPPPVQCPDGTTVAAGQTCPAVTPPPPAPSGLAGETPIADNFDYATAVVPTTYGLNGGVGIPSATAINDLGASRLDCGPGPLLKIDFLVIPGTVGVSHLHQFVGNSGINENSNYQSLRTSGGSTCGLINRSAYWFPAMIVAPGMALKPDHIFIYYKRFPASGPGCVGPMAVGICTDLPNGLRFVTGYNMKTMTGGPAGIGTRDYWSMSYDCWGSVDGTIGSGTATGIYHTIADVVAAGCPAGARLHVSIEAPTCWDGKNLDTADHRSHIVYPPDGTDKGMGYVCPADHPYVIPMMSVQLFYNTDANFVKGLWHLASDEMIPGAPAGTTLHMDYFEAWSPTAKAIWLKNCINKPASCSGGDLGNGTAIIGGTEPYPAGWPKQIPVPAVP